MVNRLIDTLKIIDEKWEIILVDDGSTDNSEFRIQNFELNKNIKLFNHQKRLGKGEALKTGIENLTGETIVFMDADLQDDPDDLLRFIGKIDDGYDFVNGIREKEMII